MIKVQISHLRNLGYCVKGIKKFYAKHGLDFKGLLQEGTDSTLLENTGDGMALKGVEEAKKELANE